VVQKELLGFYRRGGGGGSQILNPSQKFRTNTITSTTTFASLSLPNSDVEAEAQPFSTASQILNTYEEGGGNEEKDYTGPTESE